MRPLSHRRRLSRALTLTSSHAQCSADTLRRAAKAAKIDFVEVEYSPWELEMEKNGILEACRELDVKVLAYSPLGRGFLTGASSSLGPQPSKRTD